MSYLSTLKEAFYQSRPRLSTVLTGILLIVGGFWIYNNFTKPEGPINPEEIRVEQASVLSGTVEDKPQGSVAGEKIEPGIGGGTETSEWVARNISQNSLKDSSSYTVQSGDTLWEIAEGRYGSGFEWGKILEANKDKIGTLPDGSQALISPGTVLSLPQ